MITNLPEDLYLLVIVALLPLSAIMLTVQVNPYHALIIRGILGAVAALVYSVLGAADVALTEALVGTLLAITLYAVAVRSSLVMRVGVITADVEADAEKLEAIYEQLRGMLSTRYLRLKVLPYESRADLDQAIAAKELHGCCVRSLSPQPDHPPYDLKLRLRSLHDLLAAELPQQPTPLTHLTPIPESTDTPAKSS
jgi:putative multicomponent Na+:H+ antiporter subunit B